MIKECVVKLNNELVTVATYDGVDIQFPAIHKHAETIFVDKRGNGYFIVDKPKSDNVPKAKQSSKNNGVTNKKKTTKQKDRKQSVPTVADINEEVV